MNLLESKTTKVLRDSMAMITNMAKSLNLHKKQIALNSDLLNVVMKKLGSYRDQYLNKEFMATLSPPERQALVTNIQNFGQVMKDLQDEINYLDMDKHSHFLRSTIDYMEEAYMLLNFIFEDMQKDSGEIAYAKLSCIKPKNFSKAEYKIQIMNLEAELDVLLNDLGAELGEIYMGITNILIMIQFQAVYTSLSLAWKWLCLEVDRDKKADTQAYKKIEIPKEVKPEIPKAPEDKSETDIKN